MNFYRYMDRNFLMSMMQLPMFRNCLRKYNTEIIRCERVSRKGMALSVMFVALLIV